MKTKKIKFLGMFLVVFIAVGMVGFGNFLIFIKIYLIFLKKF